MPDGVDRLLSVREIKMMIEPCCCGLSHPAINGRVTPVHHASVVDNYCEYCRCEKCREVRIKKKIVDALIFPAEGNIQ